MIRFQTTTIPSQVVVLIFMLLNSSCSSEEAVTVEERLKVCSFNIRFDNPNDGFNNWENRRRNVVIFLGVEQPDIIGFQEVLLNQLEYLELRLPNYQRVGVGRDDGINQGEFAPIMFLGERFALLDSGNFWLSETPDVPSVGWDALINRICTFAVLNDTQGRNKVYFYNTHLSHVGAEARVQSMELIVEHIASNSSPGDKIILTGDLNVEPNSSAYLVAIHSGLSDSFDSNIRLGPIGTYNGFSLTGRNDRRIDYIFFSGYVSESYVSNSIVIDNQYLSDHFPVIAELISVSQ
jgi:endonuclease/exonuclease/phosphatase family metal-dependent hydrolase